MAQINIAQLYYQLIAQIRFKFKEFVYIVESDREAKFNGHSTFFFRFQGRFFPGRKHKTREKKTQTNVKENNQRNAIKIRIQLKLSSQRA